MKWYFKILIRFIFFNCLINPCVWQNSKNIVNNSTGDIFVVVVLPYLVDNSKSFFVTRKKPFLGAQGAQSVSAFADSDKTPNWGSWFPPWFSVSSCMGAAVKASGVIP